MLFISCVCHAFARLFIAALWSPAGKGLTSWLSFVMFNCVLSLSHVVSRVSVVLDCIDSRTLPLLLLSTDKAHITFP